MVTCSRCGQSNEATSRFCVACGTRLAATQSDAQPSYAQPAPPPAAPSYAAPGTAVSSAPQASTAQQAPGAPHYAPTQAVAYAAPAAPPPPVQPFAAQPYSAQPFAAQPYSAQPFAAQPYSAQPFAAQPHAALHGAQPSHAAQPHVPQPFAAQPHAPQPYGAQAYGAVAPASAAPYGVPSGVATPAPNVPAPAEPVRSKPSNAPSGARLEFAETAPPLLGEDVLSRKIQDRGAQRRAGSVAGTDEPPKAMPSAPMQREPLSVPSDAPRVLTGFLVSYEGSPLGQSWVVHQGTNLVGRSGAVAGADIELPHATVSSRHALLTASAHPGRITITDFASTNGSFVNDTALVAHEARELRDGDRIRFGLLTAIVKII